MKETGHYVSKPTSAKNGLVREDALFLVNDANLSTRIKLD